MPHIRLEQDGKVEDDEMLDVTQFHSAVSLQTPLDPKIHQMQKYQHEKCIVIL